MKLILTILLAIPFFGFSNDIVIAEGIGCKHYSEYNDYGVFPKPILVRYWTNYTWPSSNGNVLINRTNYPSLLPGDTIFIPAKSGGYRSQAYANIYCGIIAPTQQQLIHVIWQSGAYITPSTSSLQANSIDSVYGLEIRGCNQNDHIDPFFWSYSATGYLKYVLFNRDTIRGTNGFFGSFNPTLSLPAFTGDSTNCFYKVEWRGCMWDSVIGANSGETALQIGTVTSAKNQFWIYPTVDSCTFANYSSSANPASYLHLECCFGMRIFNDSFATLGMNGPVWVGHAAQIYSVACQLFIYNCVFGPGNWGDEWRNIGCGQIKGWNTVPTGVGNPNGRSAMYMCKIFRKEKYPGIETRTDPTDTGTLSPYYQFRTCPELWNLTGFRFAAGVANSYYNTSLVDAYGLDSVFLKNSTLSGPLEDTTWNFCSGQGCNALITNPNGAITVWDTISNRFDSSFALSGLGDTANFFPSLNGKLYNKGVAVPSYIAKSFNGLILPVGGRNGTGIDIGAMALFGSYIGPITIGAKIVTH